MSQHDYQLANASGSAFRADTNDLAAAIATWNSGSSFPGTTFARMRVVNTTTGAVYRRDLANASWLVESTDDETRFVSRSSNSMLDISDITKCFRATSGFTQTFDTCANLTAWWHVDYIIDASVTVIFDPSGSENIDGNSTKTVVGPASGRIYNSGTALFTVGFPIPATQSEQETGVAVISFVTPAKQQFHPSAAKAWVYADTGGNAVVSYNLSSVTDQGPGQAIANWNVDFSSGNYCPGCNVHSDVALISGMANSNIVQSAGAACAEARDTGGTLSDPNHWSIWAFGDQA